VTIHSQLYIRTALATFLNCLIAALCFAQAAPQITPADIYAHAHSSVVVVLVADSNEKPIGQGSGFIIAKNRIVTNHHVVEGASDALIVFADGTSARVEGVGADSPARDLAILVVRTGARLPLKLGDELTVRQGDSVYALGAPEGLELSLTNGILSGFRDVDDRFLLQTTAAIAHGSSGGPLFDSSGRVIGVTTAFLSDSPGIYFSIGARDISRLLRAPSSVILPLLATTPARPSTTQGAGAEGDKYARKIEEYLGEKGLSGRAKVEIIGDTVIVTGKLRATEHVGLLKFLRDAPGNVRVVDHIAYEEAPVAGDRHDVDGATGLYLNSHPEGADVFINGAKQSGQTPVTLPIAPGSYNLVIRMPGYDAYAGNVQVKDNIQTQLDVTLKEKSTVKVAWAQVETSPKGAEILVDGATTGQTTPARVQVPPGLHTVTLRLTGYRQVRRTIQASEGGTVDITDVTLQPN
jgi:hypothetical protein